MLVGQSCPTLCDPMDCSPLGSCVHEIFQARILEWVRHFLLQGIFLTQGSNPGLLYCRQILYQLSYKGSPKSAFSSVQSLSHICLCDPMDRSMPGLLVHHQLLEFTQTHVHGVGDAIQPSHPLSSPCPPAPNPSQHQGLFQ